MVRGVLDELGLNEIPVPVRVVQNEAEARQRGFSGSPTVLIDGIDPFRRAWCCAGIGVPIYPTPAGLTGLPQAAALRAAVHAAAQREPAGRRTIAAHRHRAEPATS